MTGDKNTAENASKNAWMRAAQWTLAGCVFAGWVLLSFDGLAELGREVVDWDTRKALFLPLTVDALAAMAFLMYGRTGRPEPLVVAIGAAVVSVTGNGAAWLYSTDMATPGPAAVFLVSGLAPVCGVVALHLLAPPEKNGSTTWAGWTGWIKRIRGTTRGDRTTGAGSSGTAGSSSNGRGGSSGARSSGTVSTRSRSTPARTAGSGSERGKSRQDLDPLRVQAISENAWHDLSARALQKELRSLGLGTSMDHLPELRVAAKNGHEAGVS